MTKNPKLTFSESPTASNTPAGVSMRRRPSTCRSETPMRTFSERPSAAKRRANFRSGSLRFVSSANGMVYSSPSTEKSNLLCSSEESVAVSSSSNMAPSCVTISDVRTSVRSVVTTA